MSDTVHSLKLIPYDAVDLNKLSYANGDIVFDNTNKTIRIMDGVNQGGQSLATQSWVGSNFASLISTTSNTPTNSGAPVGWLTITIGTQTYYLPAYQ